MIRQRLPFSGSHWLNLAVVACVLSICLAWFLVALETTQALAERTMVDVAARGMRTGLQLAVGEAMMRGRAEEVALWHGENPVRWLAPAPARYRGECSPMEAEQLPAGVWCFERESRQLIYAPRHARYLRLTRGDETREGLRLRWRVVVARDPSGFPSASVQLVTPYVWQID